MKKALLLIVFLFVSKSYFGIEIPLASASFDACAIYASCNTSNGINVPGIYPVANPVSLVHIASVDSMTVNLSVSGGCTMRVDSVLVDGKKVQWISGIRMLSFPGAYRIFGWNSAQNPIVPVEFTLVLDPMGIKKTSKGHDNSISLFPNPATNELSILSKNDAVKCIKIYNSAGQELENKKVEKSEVQIPLHNYPPGIYFIHVTTISDKIIIKKISVL